MLLGEEGRERLLFNKYAASVELCDSGGCTTKLLDLGDQKIK
jgi:hypothetical protein